ncbi:hypothetical protein PFLUV_G00176320 [Perca fluviatilis]|uniref:Uncharacterized protein n=1 Tax=Perca fluviatilis TaxID=8168 RepID=A0A6A5EV04_PERFL|nr:hypothetical protein PFLUV_G00176320 [Perca fluviatilis]
MHRCPLDGTLHHSDGSALTLLLRIISDASINASQPVGSPPCSFPPQAPGCTQGSSSHYADSKPGCRANQNQWPAHEDAITTIRFKAC